MSPGMRMARPGPGNGWRPTKAGAGPTQRPAAHLVLEQFAQRLDQLQLHEVGQSADIVVALDRRRGAAAGRDALDHVGIERALGQEVGAVDLLGFAVEHVDELAADDLALGLRITDARQSARGTRRSASTWTSGIL
jgi:hypothetical protein